MATTASRVAVAKTYKLYIGGQFPRTESGRYYPLHDGSGAVIANVCRASRKDFRNAVVAARGALGGWSATSAYLRGQVLYRIAEMLEGRREQFVAELMQEGSAKRQAAAEVDVTIDRLIHFAGWSDKYQQIFSAVNPVASSHFNFSVLEPMGVIAIVAPEAPGLLGLVGNLAPAIVGGNTTVVLAAESRPLSAISFAEVLHASDVPGGVVNVLTGFRQELCPHFASHMDVNAIVLGEGGGDAVRDVQREAAENIKRVVVRADTDWASSDAANPYLIQDTQETKTTWHPVGN
ncbi:MAG TPA: aldehyde dehydrogenase family protein [Woeseiaceae bacterium]|nr:aldehyde dehydrogenase family protein [Woeseiaceae bacterium]